MNKLEEKFKIQRIIFVCSNARTNAYEVFNLSYIMKILHIEDSSEIGAIFSDVLKMEGHEYESISDGRYGLEMALKNNYDVILLDMCMPDYSGMDFLLDLKTKNSSEVRKVIIITNLEFDEYQTKFLSDLGVCSIHQKPISVKYLLSKILPMEGRNPKKYRMDLI